MFYRHKFKICDESYEKGQFLNLHIKQINTRIFNHTQTRLFLLLSQMREHCYAGAHSTKHMFVFHPQRTKQVFQIE